MFGAPSAGSERVSLPPSTQAWGLAWSRSRVGIISGTLGEREGEGAGLPASFFFPIIRIILLSRRFISQNPQPNKKVYELSGVSLCKELKEVSDTVTILFE